LQGLVAATCLLHLLCIPHALCCPPTLHSIIQQYNTVQPLCPRKHITAQQQQQQQQWWHASHTTAASPCGTSRAHLDWVAQQDTLHCKQAGVISLPKRLCSNRASGTLHMSYTRCSTQHPWCGMSRHACIRAIALNNGASNKSTSALETQCTGAICAPLKVHTNSTCMHARPSNGARSKAALRARGHPLSRNRSTH